MAPQVTAITESVWLGEGPHWSHENQALYFVSVFDHTINKYDPATGQHTKSKLDDITSFITAVEGKKNHFLVGVKRKVLEVKWTGEEDGAEVLRVIVELDTHIPTNMINDTKADPRGRLFIGTMGGELEPGVVDLKKGSLYRMEADGSTHLMESNIDVANGMCWDVREKAFYYADSYEFAIRRYDYDIETGNISNPKPVFVLKDHGLEGIVDGMTIDTDGNLWVANFDASQILKVDPKKGQILQKVAMPTRQTTSCTFGGPALDTLYVTTARINRGYEPKPPGGCTFKVTGLGVKGHPNYCVKL